ncbi:MAG: AMP-binding protein, partial [Acidimicrobiales bacterium]
MGERTDGPIDQLLTRWANDERLAIVFEGTEVTYGQLADRVDVVGSGLASAGLGHSDRVVFCGLNRVELIETLLACCRIGAVFCPINNRLTPAEIAVLLADCRPTLCLATDGFDEALLAAAALLDENSRIEADAIVDLETGSPQSVAAAERGSHNEVSQGDPALMVYTSGTTGAPKGAVHTQASLLATWQNSIDHQQLTGDDCIVAPLPTFHVGGLNIQTLPTLFVGGTVVLERRFDPGAVLHAIGAYRATQTVLVPAMLAAVAAHPDFESTDFSSLVGINSGSSIVPEAVMRPFFDRGVPVGQVYGTTETGPTAVVLDYPEAAARIGSCGRPATLTELRIVDPSGHDVEDGTDGELWVRGPNVFSHYWEKPEATEAAFADGWFRTGDVGHRDADGFVTIADRVTDVIISG